MNGPFGGLCWNGTLFCVTICIGSGAVVDPHAVTVANASMKSMSMKLLVRMLRIFVSSLGAPCERALVSRRLWIPTAHLLDPASTQSHLWFCKTPCLVRGKDPAWALRRATYVHWGATQAATIPRNGSAGTWFRQSIAQAHAVV